MQLCAGDRVDRFVLEERLGAGGQAEVWRAVDPLRPGERFALKIVHVERVAESKLVRLRREAAELVQLQHPSLVACQGVFEDRTRDLFGIVMQFVEGRALDVVMLESQFDERRCFLVLRHVANALGHVHASGLVHRDVKLQNVLLTDAFFAAPEEASSVKLIDFGIAVPVSNPHPLTRAGHVVGTPPYLAPELIEPNHWGERRAMASSDVFSFGILAWRLLSHDDSAHPTRLAPDADLDEYAIAYRRAEHERWPPSFSSPKYDPLFRALLALDPRDRIAGGADLSRHFVALPTLDDPPPLERPSRTVFGEPSKQFHVPIAPTRSERRPMRRRWSPRLWAALALVIAICASFAVYAFLRNADADDVPPLPAPRGRR